jgi:hypothetical protein
MGEHFTGCGNAPYLANAIDCHGRNNFVSVILLDGIQQKEELHLAEIEIINALDCLASRKRGLPIHPAK